MVKALQYSAIGTVNRILLESAVQLNRAIAFPARNNRVVNAHGLAAIFV